MKIMDSNIILESVAGQDQFDISYVLTSGHKNAIPARAQQAVSAKTTGSSMDRQAAESVMMDRVSISSSARESYKNNYSASIAARTRITFEDTGNTVDQEQIQAVKKLINGMIDKEQLVKLGRHDINANVVANNERDSDEWQMTVTRTNVHYKELSMTFGSSGSVITEDGRTIDFSLQMEIERSIAVEGSRTDKIDVRQERIVLTDPLVINMSGRAPELTDMTFSFDLDSDGEQEQVSFLKSGSGFLVFDRNNDQKVNSGSELFGPITGNGFEELSLFDEDRNRWIDENDAVFDQLSVWTKDDEGKDVMISLKAAGVGAISLSSTNTSFEMSGEDGVLDGKIRQSGVFLFENGNVGSVQQVDLAVRTGSTVEDNSRGSVETAYAPLQETMEVQSRIMEENQTRMLKAGLDAQRFTEAAPEPINPFKIFLDMIEKLKKEFEETMKKQHSGLEGTNPYFLSSTPISGFIPGMGMNRINYRI